MQLRHCKLCLPPAQRQWEVPIRSMDMMVTLPRDKGICFKKSCMLAEKYVVFQFGTQCHKEREICISHKKRRQCPVIPAPAIISFLSDFHCSQLWMSSLRSEGGLRLPVMSLFPEACWNLCSQRWTRSGSSSCWESWQADVSSVFLESQLRGSSSACGSTRQQWDGWEGACSPCSPNWSGPLVFLN